jgi:hypothetical protein
MEVDTLRVLREVFSFNERKRGGDEMREGDIELASWWMTTRQDETK